MPRHRRPHEHFAAETAGFLQLVRRVHGPGGRAGLGRGRGLHHAGHGPGRLLRAAATPWTRPPGPTRTPAHAKLACNDCHAPQNLAAKIPFKAVAGAQDILATATKRIPDVIHAEKRHKDVIQANCVRCHTATIEKVAMDSKPYCVECHRAVPHKSRTPISSRKVADG